MQQKSQNKIKSITLSLASPEEILSWSHGEVTKPETINYKSQKPEKDGLFCEKIFGPIKDYECACGRYKKIKNKGVVCERCGVEVTESIVRRSRFGHIMLNTAIAHIWMLKTAPSKISLVLNLRLKELEEIIYFVSYIVVNPGRSGLKEFEVLDQAAGRKRLIYALNYILKNENLSEKDKENVLVYLEMLEDDSQNYNFGEVGEYLNELVGAEFGIGAEVIEKMLKNIDIKKEITQIHKEMTRNTTETPKLVKRLAILEAFQKSNNKLEWMVLHALPVMPPSLRPIIQLDGGRFTSSDINDLYRRVLIRNDRLKKMMDAEAPDIIINNEKRMLQEAVDAVLDNSRKPKPFLTKDKRPLKSLSDSLKGKQGRFRQNLLGKRVDFSARSVIVVGPDLKMYECGIPRDIALTLFKPFIISELLKNNEDQKLNIKIIERKIAKRTDDIWAILEEVIKTRPVLLNRAPTLHRLGIQAFEPKLVKSKAIKLHPLVTTAFNADFDGDQMAIHLPLSDLAIAEARALLIGSKNILGLKDGKPIVTPTQDMVLGCYYLTRENNTNLINNKYINMFGTVQEAINCYDHKKINLDDLVLISTRAFSEKPWTEEQKKGYLLTSVGKIIINDRFPKQMVYINSGSYTTETKMVDAKDIFVISDEKLKTATAITSLETLLKSAISRPQAKPFNKKTLHQIIIHLYENFKEETPKLLDDIKDLGFEYSTKSSVTISIHDLQLQSTGASKISNFDEIQNIKQKLFDEVSKDIDTYTKLYNRGLLTNLERKNKIIHEWSIVKDKVEKKIEEILSSDNIKDNPLYMIMDSGARGNISNFTQLVGMRGLMSNPKGEIMEIPIKSSFSEGLAISEFFISTHGARKGMADTALKTADSGYLTRRLVDVAQEVTIKEADCGTHLGFKVKDIVDNKTGSIIISMQQRIIGRFSLLDIHDKNGKLLVGANNLITEEIAKAIVTSGIKEVEIRSVLTCATHGGICQKCYGVNLTDNEVVKIGEPVGIIAAQSIGEPGTQLTMRTFHTGGVASGSDITQGLPRIKELFDVTIPKGRIAIISKVDGKVSEIEDDGYGRYRIVLEYKRFDQESKKEVTEHDSYLTDFNAKLRVKVGSEVTIGSKLTDGSIDLNKLLKVSDIYEVQRYILKEVQRVYKTQGIEINDKYIEIILHQMMNRVVIIDAGDTNLLPGSLITISELKKISQEMFKQNKKPPFAKAVLLGIKKAPLYSNSFLSAASFQDTTRILTQAAIASSKDNLTGIKENVILGNLIHVGTGLLTNGEILELGKEAKNKQY